MATPQKGRKKPRKSPQSFMSEIDSQEGGSWNVFLLAIILFLLVTSVWNFVSDGTKAEEITLSTLVSDIREGEVRSIVVEGDTVRATYEGDLVKETKKEVAASFTETLGDYGVDLEDYPNLEYNVEAPGGVGFWALTLLPFLLPLLLIGFFIWILTRQVKGAGVQAFNFGQSRARIIDPNDKNQRVTFKDVAGVKEAKQELLEIVEFLKNPKKFFDIGAQIPKGVLLMGAPGTGKTLLARAVAGEANVPFFSISGSEFVEMFVGVGASRVRDLFKMAKRMGPAIIFVDEIDAVGRTRGIGAGGGNDEREQTLNQILVEMDGFEPNEQVIVVAATNRPDVLDPALLRPGRFDRRVVIDAPDLSDRIEILGIHTRNKPLAEDTDLKRIAERTPGFSGAEIYSLVNEAAILAARSDRKVIEQSDFINAIEKVILGPERRSHLLSQKEKRITAFHEAGHAVVASVLPHSDPVHKISIISRGRALGYVLRISTEERYLKSRLEFLDDLAMTLAGYVTEKMIFGDVTTGPSSDLEVATSRARDMVTKYGMSDEIGPLALETDTGRALLGKIGSEGEYSEELAARIDAEVSLLMREAESRARSAIEKHRDLLEAIASRLMDQETIERDEFERLLESFGITPKRSDADQGITIAEDLSPEVTE
jgi:cell division protease FtsH